MTSAGHIVLSRYSFSSKDKHDRHGIPVIEIVLIVALNTNLLQKMYTTLNWIQTTSMYIVCISIPYIRNHTRAIREITHNKDLEL
jgi:hypothetical protein